MAEHVHLKNDFTSEEKYHISCVLFLHMLHCWNKVMVVILMHPFVINPLFKKGGLFIPLWLTQSKQLHSTTVSVTEWIGGHCLYRNIMPI